MFGVQEKITEKEEKDLCRPGGEEGGLPAWFKLLWDLNRSAATSIVVGVRRNMEFEQLEAEAQNLTTDNEKLAQALRASALEEDDDDEDNLDVIDDSETLGTDNEGLEENEDEGEEEEDHDLRDEQAVAAMRQGAPVRHSYPPLPSGCDFVPLPDDHRSSTIYSEPTYHMIAPSPDVSALHDGTSTSISIPRVDPVEIRRALALNLQYRVRGGIVTSTLHLHGSNLLCTLYRKP